MENSATVEFHYWAFISYSYKDLEFAQWLHRSLENFVVPDELVGRKTGRGYQVPDRLTPVFRDVSELPTSSDISDAIHNALRDSRYLVVVCSPHSAQSLWVNQEVLAFKRLGRENRILCVIVDGVPNATDKPGTDSSLECFPESLRYCLDPQGNLDRSRRTEPIAADCRKQLPNGRRGEGGREHAFLKVAAGLLGVNFDDIYKRHERAERRALISWATVSSILVAVFALLFAYATAQRDSARLANRDLGDLINYTIDDLQSTLEQAGRLDLLEAPLDRVEHILQGSKAVSPDILGRLRLQKAKITFVQGEKSAAIREMTAIRDQLTREVDKCDSRRSSPFFQIRRVLGFEISNEPAILETLAAVQTTLGDCLAYKADRADAAREACDQAIRGYEQLRRANPNDLRLRLGLAWAQNYRADLFGKGLETAKAIDLYRQAKSLFSMEELTPSKNGETDRLIEITVRGHLRCASLLNRDRSFTNAIKELDSANELLQAQFEHEPKNAIALEQKAFLFRDRAWVFDMLQEPVKALECLDAAVRTLDLLVSIEPQNDHYKRDLASVLLGKGENQNLPTEQSRSDIDRAVKICETGHASDPTNLDWTKVYARALRILGDRELDEDRAMDAVNAYKKLFSLGGQDSLEEDTDYALRVAGARVNFARALLKSTPEDKVSAAAVAFAELSKGEKVYDDVYSRNGSPSHLRDTAVLSDARGEIFQTIGDTNQARRIYFDTLLLRKKLLTEATPDNRDMITLDVVVNFERLARLERGLESYTPALDHFDQALQLQSDLVERGPENQKFRFNLARLYLGKAGTLQDEKRLQDALVEYGNAEKELERLLKQVPGHPDYLRELALSYYRRGQISLELKDSAAAANSLATSWKAYEAIFQKGDPKMHGVHLQSATEILALKAEAEIEAGQLETAIVTDQTMVLMLRELTEKNPGDKDTAQNFASAAVALCDLILSAPVLTEERRITALKMTREASEALLVSYVGAPPADLEKALERVRNRFSKTLEKKPD